MQSLIAPLLSWLPPSLRRLATPGRVQLLMQLVSFGLVGFAGLTVNLAVVYGLRRFVNLYALGVIGYVMAASVTWMLNRQLTFRGHVSDVPMWRQWAAFLGANTAGFILNYGTYAILISSFALVAAEPAIAVCAGAVAGMFVNFTLSRRLVFR